MVHTGVKKQNKEPRIMYHRLSVGPVSPYEDERAIAKGYASILPYIVPVTMLALAVYFGTLRELIGAGLLVVVSVGLAIEARLYDLCIRLRRTNILLVQNQRPPAT